MKKNYFQLAEEVNPGIFLHYNTFSNEFILLGKDKHDIYEKNTPSFLKENHTELYNKLLDGGFIIPEDCDETEIVKYTKRVMQFDSTMYQVMINTTLDCNLRCWYCYEDLISGSKLTTEVIEAIKKNIDFEYEKVPYKILKVSFFGGEPFMNFEGIKDILDYAKYFCIINNVRLIADFTTNATLITEEHINYLKDFRCHFQITLDGDRETHNKVKKDNLNPDVDTYQQTLNVLQSINSEIEERWVAVRVNFNNKTLEKIDEIIDDINFLDRKTSHVILKKVWQVDKEKVDKIAIHNSIQKFFDNKFLLDYYIMPKGCVCFAERNRHTLFNYDGKVFKCSTICSFNDHNSLGKLDLTTGQVSWDLSKYSNWFKDITQEECITCKWFPACMGVCNRQLLVRRDEKLCTFDAMNMDTKEYLMYSFKYHMLQHELYSTKDTSLI